MVSATLTWAMLQSIYSTNGNPVIYTLKALTTNVGRVAPLTTSYNPVCYDVSDTIGEDDFKEYFTGGIHVSSITAL